MPMTNPYTAHEALVAAHAVCNAARDAHAAFVAADAFIVACNAALVAQVVKHAARDAARDARDAFVAVINPRGQDRAPYVDARALRTIREASDAARAASVAADANALDALDDAQAAYNVAFGKSDRPLNFRPMNLSR